MASSALRPGETISGINVTPLVDVVLVLLIVLMVSASYTVSQALPMNLPKASTGESSAQPMAVSIDAQGALFLEGQPTTSGGLKQKVAELRKNGEPSVLIAADGATPHRAVVSVIDILRSEKVTQFAINVAPEDLAQSKNKE